VVVARVPLVVPLAALGAFVVLLALVVGGWAPVRDADTALSDILRSYGAPHAGVVRVTRVVTDLGSTTPFLAAGVAVTVLFAVRREVRRPAFTGLVTVLVPTMWSLMHLLIYRPRPVDAFVLIDSNGFPSGHSTNAAAAALVAVLLLWPRGTPPVRVVTVALATAFAALVGLTRVVLLAHWPSDVLGGWLLALAVVPLLARGVSGRVRGPGWRPGHGCSGRASRGSG
jgi:membrane-associated phospholipid phosphatase